MRLVWHLWSYRDLVCNISPCNNLYRSWNSDHSLSHHSSKTYIPTSSPPDRDHGTLLRWFLPLMSCSARCRDPKHQRRILREQVSEFVTSRWVFVSWRHRFLTLRRLYLNYQVGWGIELGMNLPELSLTAMEQMLTWQQNLSACRLPVRQMGSCCSILIESTNTVIVRK